MFTLELVFKKTITCLKFSSVLLIGSNYYCSGMVCELSSELDGMWRHLLTDQGVVDARLGRSLANSMGSGEGRNQPLNSLMGADTDHFVSNSIR
ncbi:hypothetical protein NPIL_224941 [Nephila pilipes]|uniref:Uncharacterized protein n=1 Tax=Nephila pilipes TaxID=299642 RepID=A0A8X6NY54_NEPPI|nr:hypothetical protein NPIL_224941 [Nephila pilipes]